MTTHQETTKIIIVPWSKAKAEEIMRPLRKRYRRCPNCGSRKLRFGVLCDLGSSRKVGFINPSPAADCKECDATL